MERGGKRKLLKTSKSKMDGELLALHWMDHKNIFSQAIKGLRGKDAFTDATLACEGHFYPVHKFVLSTCSEYFSNIFDWTPCVNPVIVINNILSTELEVLLDFMYHGEVNVKEEMISGVLHAAHCMKVKGLSVIDEEGQKQTRLSGKTASSPPNNEPPKKKQRQEVKKKVSCHQSPRSIAATFRAPPPPSRSLARPALPARLPTASRTPPTSRATTTTSRSSSLARPSAIARPYVFSRPSPTFPNPTHPTVSSPPAPVHSSSPPPVTVVSRTPSPPALVRPAVPISVPTPTSQHYVTRVPIHSTTAVVATTSAPLYTTGEVVTPVLNLSLPSTICHTGHISQSRTIELQPATFEFQNQVTYPQIISTHPQTFSGQSLSQMVHQSQVIHPHTSAEHGQTIHILTPDQHPLTQSSENHMAAHLNGAQYELHSTKQTMVSIQTLEREREEMCESSPTQETLILSPHASTQVSDMYEHQNHHPEEMEIKTEEMDPSGNTVVVSVSLADDSDPPQISIPHTLTPMDTLVEAVKMEEQNIVIKTDEGTVGIPEFLDSLEMKPMYEVKEDPERIVENPQNSSTNESLYEFTEVYPEASVSSAQPLTSQKTPPSFSASSSDLHTQSSNGRGNNSEEKLHICPQCNKGFKKRDGLTRHLKIHNKPPTVYSCTNCSFTTTNSKDFTLHKHSHSEVLKCQQCAFTTKINKELVDHKKTHAEPLNCLLCDYSSRSSKDFGEHKKTHPAPFQCPHCEYLGNRLDCLGRHLIRKHENGGPHSCQYCDNSFLSKAALSKHVKSAHENKMLKDG